MTAGNGNGHRPTLADAKTAFADIPDLTVIRSDDSVAESERAVLGAMIQSPGAAMEAAAALRPEHFASPAHQLVFEAAEALADAGQPVEPASVLAELARTGTLTKIGAPKLGVAGAFLHSLIERAGSVGYHAPRVRAAWQQRNVLLTLKSCEQIAETADWDPDVHLDMIRRRIEDATAFTGPSPLRPQSEVVLEVLQSVQEGVNPGLTTGFTDLDDATGGLRDGEVIVIGGRPGTGKSVLGLNIGDHVSGRLGLPVLDISLEMTEEELTCRRIAATATVPLEHLVRHQVTDSDWDRISRAHDRLTSSLLYVDDSDRVSLAQVRGTLRRMARDGHAARMLIIDYLQLLAEPKAESRQQAVAALARGCKHLAREFSIPVILLAQVNRGPESRADKKPVLADLRESGEIEAVADIVILLHREDAYDRESPRAGEIDLIIAKNRQGPQCTVTLCFQGHYGRIVSMAADGEPGEWSPSAKIRGVA